MISRGASLGKRGFEVWERGLRYGQESGGKKPKELRLGLRRQIRSMDTTRGRSATCVGLGARDVCVETCVETCVKTCVETCVETCERLVRDLCKKLVCVRDSRAWV